MNAQSDNSAALQARLEQLEAESRRSSKVQAALYKVAEAASSSTAMAEFYAALHAAVGELMYAGNFFIAVIDEQSNMLSWPYHVDEKDLAEDVWEPESLEGDTGATGYVIRTGWSLHGVTDYDRLIESGEFRVVGTRSLDAIFVPLRHGSSVLGALAVQSYTEGIGYTEEDVQVLEFVASHIATALTRARAIEETRRRNAELAIINSVQEGLASKLEFGSIIDLVGDKVGETFKSDTTYVFLYDRDTQVIRRPYYMERGHRHQLEPVELGLGLTSIVIETRQPLLLGTSKEADALQARRIRTLMSPDEGKDLNETYLGVPIIAGGDVVGVVSVQSYQQNAYTQADVGLLQTLSNAMSVALENARLFDETQRLLKETEQRVAELAIINSIQQGLASKLDLQGIIDLVGDKLREVLKTDEIGVRLYDEATDLMQFPYEFEHGQRLSIEPQAPSAVFRAVHRERKPVFGCDRRDQPAIPGDDAAGNGAIQVPGECADPLRRGCDRRHRG